jgi:hypothetical protein
MVGFILFRSELSAFLVLLEGAIGVMTEQLHYLKFRIAYCLQGLIGVI